jgi:hypothetical protein
MANHTPRYQQSTHVFIVQYTLLSIRNVFRFSQPPLRRFLISQRKMG